MTDSLAARWEAFTEAGRRCFADKQFDKAEEAFLAALRAAEQLDESDPRLAQSLNNLARVYGRREKFFPAAALLHRLLGIQERALGAEHPGLAGVVNNLAEMYARLGDAHQELELRERSLAIRVAAGGAAANLVAPLEQRIEHLRRTLADEQAAAARSPSPARSVRVPSPAQPAPLAPPLPASLSSIPAPAV
ncbi:MAG TPA: tetratricopeptide repeat protein, partial [Gemmatimonadaceae bacterium]|nr:tetratricopeptide repeat protein [Gemmatimonadaceae bacterium]